MSAYDLLDKSELGGIIEALQRMVSKQADRIAELEKGCKTCYEAGKLVGKQQAENEAHKKD